MAKQHTSANNPFGMDPTLQHGVPRFYWRKFASTNSDSMIWAYDIRNPSKGVHHTSIRSIDSSNTLHSNSQAKRKRTWENKAAKHLAEVVAMDAARLNILLRDSSACGLDIRSFLADFCLTMSISSHAVRDRAEELNESEIRSQYEKQRVLDTLLSAFKPFMPLESHGLIEAIRVNEGDSPRDWWRLFHVSTVKDSGMIQTLRDGNWILKLCPEGRFLITSDIAVMPFDEEFSSLYIPLSSSRLVFATQYPTEPTGLYLTDAEVDAFNMITIGKALQQGRWICSPTEHELKQSLILFVAMPDGQSK